jgi:hypothetical protein
MKPGTTISSHRRRCRFTKADGSRCKARPLRKREFCFWHDPEETDARKAAGKLGGSRGRLRTPPIETSDVRADNAVRIVKLLSRTINQTLRGEIDPKVANAVGYLSGIIMRAREQGEFEDRLKKVEERLAR